MKILFTKSGFGGVWGLGFGVSVVFRVSVVFLVSDRSGFSYMR